MIEFAIAATDADRQAARAFVVKHNGAHFCPADAHPAVIVGALDSFPPRDITWLTARQDGVLVAALAEVVHVLPEIHNLNLVGAVSPDCDVATVGAGLIRSVTDLLEYDGCCGGAWPWRAILSEHSPMLPVILDVYEPMGHITVTPYDEAAGLVRLDGLIRGNDD